MHTFLRWSFVDGQKYFLSFFKPQNNCSKSKQNQHPEDNHLNQTWKKWELSSNQRASGALVRAGRLKCYSNMTASFLNSRTSQQLMLQDLFLMLWGWDMGVQMCLIIHNPWHSLMKYTLPESNASCVSTSKYFIWKKFSIQVIKHAKNNFHITSTTASNFKQSKILCIFWEVQPFKAETSPDSR